MDEKHGPESRYTFICLWQKPKYLVFILSLAMLIEDSNNANKVPVSKHFSGYLMPLLHKPGAYSQGRTLSA